MRKYGFWPLTGLKSMWQRRLRPQTISSNNTILAKACKHECCMYNNSELQTKIDRTYSVIRKAHVFTNTHNCFFLFLSLTYTQTHKSIPWHNTATYTTYPFVWNAQLFDCARRTEAQFDSSSIQKLRIDMFLTEYSS